MLLQSDLIQCHLPADVILEGWICLSWTWGLSRSTQKGHLFAANENSTEE